MPEAYHRIEVIGQSPLSHSSAASEWTGTNADGVLIRPLTDFGSTLDEPYGRLRDLYEIESIPDAVIAAQAATAPQAAYIAPQTVEEVFEDASGGPERAKPAKVKRSPLAATDGASE